MANEELLKNGAQDDDDDGRQDEVVVGEPKQIFDENEHAFTVHESEAAYGATVENSVGIYEVEQDGLHRDESIDSLSDTNNSAVSGACDNDLLKIRSGAKSSNEHDNVENDCATEDENDKYNENGDLANVSVAENVCGIYEVQVDELHQGAATDSFLETNNS